MLMNYFSSWGEILSQRLATKIQELVDIGNDIRG